MLLELGNLTVLEPVQRARAGLVHYLVPHENYFEIQVKFRTYKPFIFSSVGISIPFSPKTLVIY